MLNGFGVPHLLIIAALIIILFGAKRLPDAARGMGRAMRIFRSETQGMREDSAAESQNAQQQQHQQPQQQLAPPPPVAPAAQAQPVVADQPAHVPPTSHSDQQR